MLSWRRIFGLTIILFSILLLSCNSIEWWKFYGGLIGLALDLFGAALIVITDISFFDRLWENEEEIRKADQLRAARLQLFDTESIDWDTTEREVLMEVIRSQIDLEVRDGQEPDDLHAASSGNLSTRGYTYIRYDKKSTEINKDWDKVGRNDLVKKWVDGKIKALEQTVREYIRGIGLISLLIGFSLQLIGYTLLNTKIMATILLKYSFCGCI